MDDTLLSIIGIVLAAIIMFLFPLITMADRADDVSQLTVKIATSEFAKEVIETGKITSNDYNKLQTTLGSTGNNYDIEIEAKILDKNPSIQSIGTNGTSSSQNVTENVYYSIFTSQILDTINNNNNDNGVFYLKEGDIILINVKNSSLTMAQQLKNVFYKVFGKSTYIIAASGGGMVTVTGK